MNRALSRPDWQRLLLEASLILLVGVLIGLTVNYRLVLQVLEGRPPSLHPQSQLPSGEAYPSPVLLEELQKLLAEKGGLLIDARVPELYSEGHIPGARSLPLEEVERLLPLLRREIPLGATLIVYCSGYGCPDSMDLALRLIAAGYGDVRVFEGGLPEWREAGLPVAGGTP